MISIIIPLYNKELYIEKTIASVLSQSFTDFELLVVDDGSKDGGAERVRNFKDPRIKLFTNENSGVSGARNFGIRNAGRDYVAFLDADDHWKNNYLESIVHLINTYPEAKVYATNFNIVSEKMVKNPATSGLNEGYIENYFKAALKQTILHTSSVAATRSIFDEIGYFNEDLTRGEDLDLWTRMGRTYKIAYFPEACSNYLLETVNSSSKFVPHPNNSFAYLIDLKTAKDKYEYFYLRRIALKKTLGYLIINHKWKFFFMMIRRHNFRLVFN